MALPTDDDMIIVLTEHVQNSGHNPTFEYAKLDTNLNFPEGTVERLLEVAADDAGYEVVKRGATHARLQRRPARLIRA
jgi:hypothetical protein